MRKGYLLTLKMRPRIITQRYDGLKQPLKSAGTNQRVLDYLLAPREDHRGWKTPSEASRILLVVVVLSVAYWAWPIT